MECGGGHSHWIMSLELEQHPVGVEAGKDVLEFDMWNDTYSQLGHLNYVYRDSFAHLPCSTEQ